MRRNPVLPGCYPDPSVCRVGDDYYLVTSTFEYFPALPVFHSTDLESWTQLGHAVDRESQLDLSTVPSSGGLFAPTIRHHDGTWYLVCTLVGGTGRGGNFVITATDPGGPWSDPVWLDGAGIDPSLFFDDDGRAWFTGTRLAAEPAWHDQTEVWLREFDPATLALTGPEHVLWTGALVGAVWAEGPHLYRRDGWYYLLASEGGTDVDHALSVARSRTVTGPYTGNPANPVLTHRNLGAAHPIRNVGHADLVQTPDGGWAALLLATRGASSTLGRETFAVDVVWERDWPVFAPGVGQVLAGPGRPRPRAMPPALEWTRVRTGDGSFATVDADAARVLLRPGTTTVADVGTPAFVGVRQTHAELVFGATVATGRLRAADVAGLAIRQSEGDHVLFAVRGAQLVADRRIGGRLERIAAVPVPLSAPAGLALEVVARAGAFELWAAAAGDRRLVAAVDGAFLSSGAAGGFLGVWLGLFVEGSTEVEFTDVFVEAPAG